MYKRTVRFKVLMTTGDVNSLDYGGGVVYQVTDMSKAVDDPHRTWITFEWWDAEDYYQNGKYMAYSCNLESHMIREWNWLLNKTGRSLPPLYQPTGPSHLSEIASSIGVSVRDLIRAAKSPDFKDRVWFIECVRDHFGSYELDQYPLTFTRRELRRRWRKHVGGSTIRERNSA